MKHILHIDDDDALREVVQIVLADKGYEVFTTGDVEEGIRILRQSEVDMVLLDVDMPQKHGFVLYREIEAQRRVPVLFLTACPKSFDANSPEFVALWNNLFSLGMTDVLYKPFQIEALYEKVESLIGESEAIENGQAR